MNLRKTLIFLIILLSAFQQKVVLANPQLALVEGARANMKVLDTRLVQSEQFTYQHAVSIALPATYSVLQDKRYPVIWVLDDPLMTRTVIATVDLLVSGNLMPEAIVIGVGSPAEEGLAGVGRRILEFSPPGKGFPAPGINAEAFNSVAPFPEYPHLADEFLTFLADELRPSLEKEFRFKDDHTLHGHSLGGLFAGYTLFTRPDLFNRMILGSPAIANVNDAVFKLEESFALNNNELNVELYIGAGGAEGNEWFLNAGAILSATSRFIERLNLRDYEGLTLQSQFYSGENHYTVAPRIISDALRHFYREEAENMGSTWPQKPAGSE